jgi:hypothetical protein
VLPIIVVKNASLSLSIKESLTLFLKKSGYTIGAVMQIVTLGLLLLVTVVSIPLLFAGMLSIFMINIYDNLNHQEDASYQLSHITS